MTYIQIRNIPTDKKAESKSDIVATNMAISISSIVGVGHFPEERYLLIGNREQPNNPLILKDIDKHFELFCAFSAALSREHPGMIDCNDYRKKGTA